MTPARQLTEWGETMLMLDNLDIPRVLRGQLTLTLDERVAYAINTVEPQTLALSLSKAVEALKDCIIASGADVSGGFPAHPPLAEYAVQCVRQLRKDYEER